jgi:hypothetical protein
MIPKAKLKKNYEAVKAWTNSNQYSRAAKK